MRWSERILRPTDVEVYGPSRPIRHLTTDVITMPHDPPRRDDPATLVAIALAAHRSGDRDLLREARRELRQRHGIDLSFRRPAKGDAR